MPLRSTKPLRRSKRAPSSILNNKNTTSVATNLRPPRPAEDSHDEGSIEKTLQPLAELQVDNTTCMDDKLARVAALHAKWKWEDSTTNLSDSDSQEEVKRQQYMRCQKISLVVFGFLLREAQVEAIWTLFYKRQDLLLLAKTGFGKSLIFQLVPFMPDPTGVVIILMPLELLQVEQNAMINRIPNGKAIALTGKNNQKNTRRSIANGGYTHIFTSPEIALSKNFKSHILDDHAFSSRLCLLAIDEIHLVEQWGQNFRPLYAEIEKLRKRILHQVPLLGVLATLTKKMQAQVLAKSGFYPDFRLMKTSLDRPEIMQIHRFMEHSKASCLDLQFILPPRAKKASDIQKTVIFVNTIAEIRPMIAIIRAWMRKLGYPPGSEKWIRPYYSIISDWDKSVTTNAFKVTQEDNTECTILVATDAYGMGIDNPDIKLVVQYDISTSFDAMIQRMGRAGRKGNQATFILLTPKWSQVKSPDEIAQYLAKRTESLNIQPSDTNRVTLPANPSPLSREVAAEDVSDMESLAGSEKEFNILDDLEADQFFNSLGTNAELLVQQKKKDCLGCKSDAEKRAKLSNEIFDYIHVAPCRRLFSLTWYEDTTYASPTAVLPTQCCNGSKCQSAEPDFLKRQPFIENTFTASTENDRKWFACRTAALKH